MNFLVMRENILRRNPLIEKKPNLKKLQGLQTKKKPVRKRPKDTYKEEKFTMSAWRISLVVPG
jgi:hypothetical protein